MFWLDNSTQADVNDEGIHLQPVQLDGDLNCSSIWIDHQQDIETQDLYEPGEICFENIREHGFSKKK